MLGWLLYVSISKQVKQLYEQRLVAFIDILGFKDIVKKSEVDDRLLDYILEAMSFLKSFELPGNWRTTTIEIEESA